MKHVQIVGSFHNVAEGWAHVGMIWNVGEEHTPGLRVIHEDRAIQLIKAKRAVEYSDGDTKLTPKANDPAFLAARQRAINAATVAVDNFRQTKVMPDPLNKQPSAPTRPRRVANPAAPATPSKPGSTPSASPPPKASTPGGKTGAKPSSSSSSPPVPAARKSTGQKRGLRRADPAFEAKRESSRSTKAGSSAATPTSSTPPTEPSGKSTTSPDQKAGAAARE